MSLDVCDLDVCDCVERWFLSDECPPDILSETSAIEDINVVTGVGKVEIQIEI